MKENHAYFQVKYKKDYEPYVVLKKKGAPCFRQNFLYGHKDKRVYIYELNYMRYAVHSTYMQLFNI